MFEFKLLKKDGNARIGKLTLSHGEIQTPVFMPVGTYGTVKAINPKELDEANSQIILGNTFHLWLRPGIEVINHFKGLHNFISWKKPILTDSGGFQVFSLSKINKITQEGCIFKSPIDGKKLFLSPEIAIKIQSILNSDIVMQLDECLHHGATYDETAKSVKLSIQWAKRSKEEFYKQKNTNSLFGIIQGGMYKDLRLESLQELMEIDFDGVAIGGLSVGETKEQMYCILDHLQNHLPENKPHYLMGVGTPEDIVYGVSKGIDLFDCVMPTRNARNGCLFTTYGNIKIKNAIYKNSDSPIDNDCNCYTCRNFSKGYINHLHKSREILAFQLSTIHNVYYYNELMSKVRKSIENNNFTNFVNEFHKKRNLFK